MNKILVYIAIQDGKVKRSSLEVLSRCRALASHGGGELAALIAAPDASAYVEQVGKYGAQTVYTIDSGTLELPLNTVLVETLATAVEQIRPGIVAFGSTETVKDILGALAVRLSAAALPDVSRFEVNGDTVEALRPVMASKVLARTTASGNLVLVSVRSGAYEAVEHPVQPTVVPIAFEAASPNLAQQLREVVKATVGGMVDLAEAEVVVAAGRGIKDETGKQLVESLAGVMGGAVGATRAAVESGLFPATAQIGQTGKVVSPGIYFAVGVSGAIQHVAGMSNSRIIVAINKDADAPIFKYATYGLVGDLYQILPPLIEALRQAKAA